MQNSNHYHTVDPPRSVPGQRKSQHWPGRCEKDGVFLVKTMSANLTLDLDLSSYMSLEIARQNTQPDLGHAPRALLVPQRLLLASHKGLAASKT